MSSFVTNKYVSRIDQGDFDKAIGKLSYEIQHRKKEFLSQCTKYDPNYKSRISTTIFAEILNNFTVYPSDFEKKLIIYKIAINDKYIDYLNLAESPRINEEEYKDIFLQHLNDVRFKKYNQQKNILPSSATDRKKEVKEGKERKNLLQRQEKKDSDDNKSDISNDFGLLPIEITNAEINEENFLRKVSKDLMTYILTHTKGERPKEFTNKLFKKFDFDNDDKYTIGEFNNFLMACELVLSDPDLRFFYENFPVIDGRVSIKQINDFIENNSEKNFETINVNASEQFKHKNLIKESTLMAQGIEEKLEKQKTHQKRIEDQRIVDMMKKNYISNTLKDCLLIFGRDYLMEYFSKYFFNFEGKLFIEDNSFLLGLCSFGYKMPSGYDIGNFKYVCIHKNIARVRGLAHSLIIDFEGLIDFIIEFFEIEETIKLRGAEELINNIGSTYLDIINESFLQMVTDIKKKNTNEETINENEININKNINKKKVEEYLSKSIGEKDFRKKFINNFGFIDHQFFDDQIHKFCGEEINIEKNFNPNLISVKKFVEFSYNFLFLYMIKNYKSLGILLDPSTHNMLNELYSKIKYQIFPEQNNDAQNKNNKEENPTNLFNNINQIQSDKKTVLNIETNLQNNINNNYLRSDPDLNEKIPYQNITKNFEEEKIDPNGINTYILNKKIIGSIKINDENKTITDKYKTIKPTTRIVNSDPIEAIPLLYNICVKYIINLFKLERVSFNLLKGIGICKIFRDYFNKKRGKKQKIHWMVLIQNLESLVPEIVINFLRKIALDNKDSDGNITLQFYFSKLEQILLQYNLSLEEDKNFAKYYV